MMTHQEEFTNELYLCINKHPNRSNYIVEVFIKEKGCVWYAVLSYAGIPSKQIILRDTYAMNIRSPRPYKAGQPCDGSITACVFHLYNQLCHIWGLDPVALYNEAYNDHIFTKGQLDEILRFAEWQGVETITKWSREKIDMVFESIHEVNMHQLAGVLENRIPL